MDRQETIVVVDDSAAITRLLKSVLSQEGYNVLTTNDPLEALPLVERQAPHLVILDVCMPGIDGWEVCRRIRAQHSIPIMVLTVRGESGDIEETYRAGADAYMTKPFVISELLDLVERLLNRGIRRLDV